MRKDHVKVGMTARLRYYGHGCVEKLDEDWAFVRFETESIQRRWVHVRVLLPDWRGRQHELHGILLRQALDIVAEEHKHA